MTLKKSEQVRLLTVTRGITALSKEDPASKGGAAITKGVIYMASMVPYRSVFGIRPTTPASLLDAFDDMMDLTNMSFASKAFPIDVADTGDGYEIKAYLTGVAKDEIDVELNEGRLSISVNVAEKEEGAQKNYLQREFTSYSATRGVYLKDASSEGLAAKYADGVLTVTVPKIVEKKNVTKIAID